MKTIAYVALHYGACYLASAIRSVIDDVNELYVFYTDVGSHGHQTTARCPDTQEELHQIARDAAHGKLRWVTSRWEHEGTQRGYIDVIAMDADIVIPLDYDEIWHPGLLDVALKAATDSPTVRRWRVPFRHYWRSFDRCILHDPAYPHRLYNRRGDFRQEVTLVSDGMAVNHMGYAIPPKLMRYKWEVHGHKNELRHDVDYFADIYEANRQYDCHPVGSEWWTPEIVDPFAEGWLPDWMKDHPFAKMEMIE